MSDQAEHEAGMRARGRGLLCPAARYRPAKTGGTEDGTTLIELLVVLAVLALAAAMALPAVPPGRGPSLGLAAADIAARLRSARSMAIAENRDVSFALDTDKRSYGIVGKGASQTLPAAVEISVTTARQAVREAGEAQLVFFSDGTSSGGIIRLRDGRQSVAVGVEWLTGSVRIERGTP